MKLLEKIKYPEDLRRLSVDELPQVCQELREDIVQELSVNPVVLDKYLTRNFVLRFKDFQQMEEERMETGKA